MNMTMHGKAFRFGDDINTDYIISSKNKSKILDRKELAQHLMEDIRPDFAKEIKDGSKATIKLSVKDPKGNSHKVQGEVYVDLFWGSKYKLNLSGDTDNGYFLGH